MEGGTKKNNVAKFVVSTLLRCWPSRTCLLIKSEVAANDRKRKEFPPAFLPRSLSPTINGCDKTKNANLRLPLHSVSLAMTHLDKLRLWGKPIRVMGSKHQAVQLPKEGQPDAGLTRDYAQNPLHRFKKPGSKNYQNIYPPSATLHLSNIPATVAEEELREAFVKNAFDVKAFKFFP